MAFVAAKCTECGASIEVDDSKEAGICKHCGTAFVTQKVITNQNTYVTQHVTKNIYGKEKTEAEEYLANGETFVRLKDWGKAIEAFTKASEVGPNNFKTWLGLVRSETKDFTDLDDVRHVEHYRRALAVASDEEKKTFEQLCGRFITQSKEHQAKQLELKKARDDEEFLKVTGKAILRGLVIGLLSFAIAIILFCSLCVPAIRDSNIAQNTKLTIVQATMLEIDPVVDMSDRHRIRYSYIYDGQTKEVWTKKTYSIETAKKYEKQGYLEIRISKSGRPVDIKFRTVYATGYYWGLILSPIIILVAIFCFAVYPRAFIQYRSIKRIMKCGQGGIATFIESKPIKYLNKIRFSYKDADGKENIVWSKREYTGGTVIAVRDMKEFPIKYYGPDAIIEIAVVDKHLQENKKRLIGE